MVSTVQTGGPHFHSTSHRSVETAPMRKVSISDTELRRRVERVQITTDFNNALANVSLHGWKWKSDKRDFSVFTKEGSAADGSGATVSDAEVLVMGTVTGGCALNRLVSLLGSPNENDLNSLMQALYKGDFIYGSVVHADEVSNSLVAVKTCAFARSKRFSNNNNEQMCYVEQFRPTKDGCAVVFTSLPQHEVAVGKASGKHVDELCPVRGWLLVEKAPESKASVRILYYAGLDQTAVASSRTARVCSAKTTAARLLRLGKGICRLGEFLHQQSQMDSLKGKKNRQKGANYSAAESETSNTHCVACTTKFDLLHRRRRCGLCSYNACSKCCFNEPMVIYNRYASTIQFCARCRECMAAGEYPHLQLAARRHSAPGVDAPLV